MTTTPNLGLTKDDITDLYSVERVNENSDRIDNYAGTVNTALAGKASTASVTALTTWETYDCLSLGGVLAQQYIDDQNSSVTVKVNTAQKRVVIAAQLKIKADLASTVNEFQVGSLSGIDGYADMVPLVPLRYSFTSKAGNYSFGAQRANNSALCTIWVIDGTIPEDSTIYFEFDYTYF